MKEKLSAYIDSLFADAPKTQRAYELREELLSNLNAKYDDMISLGYSEEDAYKAAIAGIGDVSELISALNDDGACNNIRQTKERRQSAFLVSAAVMLYILAVVPVIMKPGTFGVILMFVFVAAATGMLVFNAMTRPKYKRMDDTVVEEFKQWKNINNDKIRVRKAISAAMWPLIVVVYLFVSIYFCAWTYSWILFVLGAAIENIIKLIFELNTNSK